MGRQQKCKYLNETLQIIHKNTRKQLNVIDVGIRFVVFALRLRQNNNKKKQKKTYFVKPRVTSELLSLMRMTEQVEL